MKKITIKRGDRFQHTKEIFEVLKDNESIRQGSYEKYYNDKLEVSGFYSNNLKDSIWTDYFRGKLVSVRHYTNGSRTGLWEFFSSDGDPEMRINMDTDSITFVREKKDSVHRSIKNDSSKRSQFLDDHGKWEIIPAQAKSPQDLFSMGYFLRFLNHNLKYPNDAIDKEQMGTVWIGIIIDEAGLPVDYAIEQSSSFKSLDEEALRVWKNFQGEYFPAVVNGKKVRSKIIRPLIFKLETSHH
ncbi:MAG TPA: TonB family protein [Puia sp.]|nr:TonB family protein [Puia sp.]